MQNKIFSHDALFLRKSILNIKRRMDLINKLKHKNMLETIDKNLLQRTELCIFDKMNIFNNL